MQSIVNNYEEFDKFLKNIEQKENGKSRIYYFFYSIRTTFAINTQNYIKNRFFLRLFIGIMFIFKIKAVLIFSCFLKPVLVNIEGAGGCIYGDNAQEKYVAQQLGIPYTKIKYLFCLTQLYRNLHLWKDLVVILYYINQSNLDRIKLFRACRDGLKFLVIYDKIDFKLLQCLFTEDDLFPEGFAVVQSARNKGVRTIKGDYFLIDDIYINNINCEFYFFPNEYHRSLLAKFPYNKIVKYVKGGYMSWDSLAQYKYCPNLYEEKIIVFFAQYAVIGNTEKKYIDDLIDFVRSHDGYLLIIKAHPRHKGDYSEFEEPRVKVVKGGGEVSYKLVTKASFTFSVFSVLTLEAKHICRNSYYINYDIDNLEIPFDYKAFELYIDIVRDKDTLFQVLEEKFQPTEIEQFIEHVNPTYPNTCKALKELVL